VSHQRRLILDTTYVDEADETGCAVLHGSRRLKARIVALPASRVIAEPLIDLRLPAARKSALDEHAGHASASASQNRAERIEFSDKSQMECELR
jgi:hypothetical protein